MNAYTINEDTWLHWHCTSLGLCLYCSYRWKVFSRLYYLNSCVYLAFIYKCKYATWRNTLQRVRDWPSLWCVSITRAPFSCVCIFHAVHCIIWHTYMFTRTTTQQHEHTSLFTLAQMVVFAWSGESKHWQSVRVRRSLHVGGWGSVCVGWRPSLR